MNDLPIELVKLKLSVLLLKNVLKEITSIIYKVVLH